MDQPHTKDRRELCKAAANESDPEKLMVLVAEITKALDERDARRYSGRENQKHCEAAFSVLGTVA